MVAVGIPVPVVVLFRRYAVDNQIAFVVSVQSADNIE